MRKLLAIGTIVFLYIMTLLFGITWGWLKSGSWNIHDWGHNTAKYVSIWWAIMGGLTTVLAMLFVGLFFFRDFLRRMAEDEKERIKADHILDR